VVDLQSLKNDGVRQLGLFFPTEWKNQTCSKPPTSIYMYVWAMNDIKIGCARNTKTLVTLDGQ
jgi:hypothetical protein